MLSHCHCARKSERDSMRFLWLQSARWLGFPGGTDNYNFDVPCGSGGRLKMFATGRFRRSYATAETGSLQASVDGVTDGRSLTDDDAPQRDEAERRSFNVAKYRLGSVSCFGVSRRLMCRGQTGGRAVCALRPCRRLLVVTSFCHSTTLSTSLHLTPRGLAVQYA